jgi:hypothetical protein
MADKVEGSVVPVEPGFLNYVVRAPVGVVGQIVRTGYAGSWLACPSPPNLL